MLRTFFKPSQSLPSLPKSFSTFNKHTLKSFENVPSAKITVLPNGMRVVSEQSHLNTCSVGIFIDAGSRYETEENNGVAHFLEHLSFKGTRKRSQYGLEIEIENMGAHLNAYTSREQTVYFMKLLKKDMARGVEVLSDMLQNSVLDPQAIERERSVILREGQEVAKNAQEVVFDNLHLACFPDNGLGLTILGSEMNISTLKRNNLLQYIATHYTGPRMVVAAAGAVDHDDLVALTTKHFGAIPSTNHPDAMAVRKRPPVFVARDALLNSEDPRVDSVNFAIAFPAPNWSSADAVPFALLQCIIGNWDYTNPNGFNSHSNLIREVSTNNLARSVSSFHTIDVGLFGVYASCDPASSTELVKLICSELCKLSSPTTYTAELLELVKNQIKVSLMAPFENTAAQCEDLGRHMLIYDRRIHPIELVHRIDAVDIHALVNCARKFIHNRSPSVSAYGPLENFPKSQQIRQFLSPPAWQYY